MFRRYPLIRPAAALLFAVLLFGCAPDGKALLEREQCLECHRFRGEGGYLGPDLTAVAARRPEEWMVLKLKNPKKADPASRMPTYDNLSLREVRAIVKYLQSDE